MILQQHTNVLHAKKEGRLNDFVQGLVTSSSRPFQCYQDARVGVGCIYHKTCFIWKIRVTEQTLSQQVMANILSGSYEASNKQMAMSKDAHQRKKADLHAVFSVQLAHLYKFLCDQHPERLESRFQTSNVKGLSILFYDQ